MANNSIVFTVSVLEIGNLLRKVLNFLKVSSDFSSHSGLA